MRMRKMITSIPLENGNGICFHSERHKGCSVIATVNEQGTITTEWTKTKEYKKKAKIPFKERMKEGIKNDLFRLPLAILIAKLLIWAMKESFICYIRISLIICTILVINEFAIYIVSRIRRTNIGKFNAASHMVQNAYRKLGRVPSIEEIEKYSRYHNFCQTNLVAPMVLIPISIFACTFITNSFLRLLGVIYAGPIVILISKSGALNFVQRLTTIPPTERELSVAIAGMKEWEKREGKI